jgi:hypothetical protein
LIATAMTYPARRLAVDGRLVCVVVMALPPSGPTLEIRARADVGT